MNRSAWRSRTGELLLASLLLAVLSAGASGQQRLADVLRPHAADWERLVAAEDGRARSPEQLATLEALLASSEPELRRLAVRALGRLERPELVAAIAPLLRDPAPGVRAQAAHALGQAVYGRPPGTARAALLEALTGESDDGVLAALLETLGRQTHTAEAEARVTIDQLLRRLDGPPAVRLGALRGLYFLARQPQGRAPLAATGASTLRRLPLSPPAEPGGPAESRARTLVIATLIAAGAADEATLATALADPAAQVRREAAAGAAALPDTAAAARLILHAMNDPAGPVRYEALRGYGRVLARSRGCGLILTATWDADAHVALLAIDLLGTQCAAAAASGGAGGGGAGDARGSAVVARLDSLAGTLPGGEAGDWHGAAHALSALARHDAGLAAARLPTFADHPNFFVRSYAAGVAGTLRDTVLLRRLAHDAHPNVRTGAVLGLRATAGPAAAELYLAQLQQDDSQLLQAAAAALEASAHPGAPGALLDALDRVSGQRRETSREARRALLARVQQLGGPELAGRVRPYLSDFDPLIASLAADVLERWTGTRPEPTPVPPPLALPTFGEAAALEDARLRIELAGGGTIELRLLPFDAPTNVARFVRLARAGDYDGLTLHRVAPNFVVQGGSPNANEYAGDGPYTRDEVGLANWRGTVGLSTRGRDTGDAQLFINLIDNVRLDHNYTVWAEVLQGLEIVDRLLEGAVMARLTVEIH